jgi:hypothetical protein
MDSEEAASDMEPEALPVSGGGLGLSKKGWEATKASKADLTVRAADTLLSPGPCPA